MHPDDLDAVRRELDRASLDGSEHRFDARVLDANGRTRQLQVRGLVVRDADGRPLRTVSVAIDLTEQRLLEGQLRQGQKMEAIGQLAGGVAHDFNNLLTAILGYARFLLPTLADEQRSDLQEVINAADRAATLTRQLLAFSRQQTQQLSVVDLNLLIQDLANMLRRLIGESITLETVLGPSLAPVHADRGQLEQVIMNLVVNARDAMPSGGTVRIETANALADGRDTVRLIVADTGAGMTDETRTHLFEPFFTTKQIGEGTGFGLATVFGIVTQSGGSIAVHSTLGMGSAFQIDFPRAHGDVPRLDPVLAAPQGGSESILLVEDEEAVRSLARVIFSRSGYQVVGEAGSVGDALQAAETAGQIDLLVTDVVMPGGTGPELFRRLAEKRPWLRVLYMSGYARETILDTRQLDRHAGFLAKPFTAESLTLKIREVLDREL